MPRRREKRNPSTTDAVEVEEFHPLNAESPSSDKPKVEEYPHGKPLKYDPKFKGPIEKRSCTDVICCLIFLIFVAGLVVVGYFAFTYGNPRLLLYPMNSDKELCGFGNQKGKNYLLFYDLVACGKMGPGVFVDGCPTTQICVSECPTENWFYKQALDVKANLRYCKPSIDLSTTTKSFQDLVTDEDCPAYTLDSEPFLHRCVPRALTNILDDLGTLEENVKNMKNATSLQDRTNTTLNQKDLVDSFSAYGVFLKAKEYGEKIIQDVVASWWMIVVGYLIAMAISLIWIVLMRWIAGVMVWLTILLFVGVFGFSSFWCIKSYMDVKDTEQSFHIHMSLMTFSFSKENFWLAFGIISVAILAIVILVLLILCQRIRIAIELIKESSKAVGNMLFTLIFPVFTYTLIIIVIAYWLISSVYLASTGRAPTFDLMNGSYKLDNGSYDFDAIQKETKSLFDELPCDNQVNNTLSEICGVVKHAQEGAYTFYLQIYNLFMLFWMVNFCIALGEMALAGAFASYYWAFNKPKDVPTFPLLKSVWRCFRFLMQEQGRAYRGLGAKLWYHLGSLAFGSLIIAIIQIIRVFLEYLDHKLKGSENPVAKFFMKCLKCCFWCLEKFIRFLNKNAYIMIAIHGKNFCASAKDAFMIILRNVVRVLVVDKVTDFLLLIGKLLVVGAVASSSFFFFNGDITFLNAYKPTLNFYVVPVILVTVGSFVVASCFFSVYNMAVDTMFLCFLEDLERNDGTNDKPYYMPKNLMKILGKKNKLGDAE